MRRSTIILILPFCLLVQACVESFDLKNISYDNLLVVEGHISNINRPQQIKLSHTSKLNERVFDAESDAVVIVENESGEKAWNL